MGKLEVGLATTGLTKEQVQDVLDGKCNPELPDAGVKYSEIVREFKKSGKYANFDYNFGGIQQLVKDFEDGKIYDGMFEEDKK